MTHTFFPAEDWQRVAPETAGLDAQQMQALERQVELRYRTINGFLVLWRGYLVSESYLHGFGRDDRHLVASVTKSFISALIGIAIEQGHIEGVEQKVLDFFPEFEPSPQDGLKQVLTIRHLLTMTAGFQWRMGKHLHELYIDRLRRSPDWAAFILSLPVMEESFGRFQYNSGLSHLLSVILTRATGLTAADFAAEHLFGPIGMQPPAGDMTHGYSSEEIFRNTSGQWPRDPQGNNIGGWGLYLTPRDMARFGLLYLNSGQWKGSQIVPEEWVNESTRRHTPGYGYQWWLRDLDGIFSYSAVGMGGNHIFCIPEKDLVIVVAAGTGSRWRDRWLLLEEHLLPGIN